MLVLIWLDGWMASLSCPTASERVSLCAAVLQGRQLFSLLLGGSLHKLFMILLHGRLVSLPHLLMYSITYLCQCGLMGICFILWALIHGCQILLHTALALGFLACLLSVPRSPWAEQ